MERTYMDAIAADRPTDARLSEARARIGLIIPSVNSLSEPQFNRFAPAGLGVHVTRARVAGEWKRPLDEMASEIAQAALLLADCGPDLIVFHCTDTSMTAGPTGEERLLSIIREAAGIEAVATSRLVLQALNALAIDKVLVISPYRTNENVIRYLRATGFDVVHDVALGLTAREFVTVPPQRWVEIARENDRSDANGIFLSCTNTTQIEAITEVERTLGKPVVNSNQAVLWACVNRLRSALGTLPSMPALGRLMQQMNG
jgi:maleate cis-trans isomerase